MSALRFIATDTDEHGRSIGECYPASGPLGGPVTCSVGSVCVSPADGILVTEERGYVPACQTCAEGFAFVGSDVEFIPAVVREPAPYRWQTS